MDIKVKQVEGKYIAAVVDGGLIVFVTDEYITERMALADARCWIAFRGDKVQPRKIKFETYDCGRCEGRGTNNQWGFSRNECYACKGRGFLYTKAGDAAERAYAEALDAAFRTTFGALAVGDRYRVEKGGKVWAKGGNELNPAKVVFRVDAVAKLRIMREIAAAYPGASLVY